MCIARGGCLKYTENAQYPSKEQSGIILPKLQLFLPKQNHFAQIEPFCPNRTNFAQITTMFAQIEQILLKMQPFSGLKLVSGRGGANVPLNFGPEVQYFNEFLKRDYMLFVFIIIQNEKVFFL